jgi:uncharacterized protein YbjT (DUF2867 family)/uncharacterized membrane protein
LLEVLVGIKFSGMESSGEMRVLVVGGYGLIGLEVVRALREAGMEVTGFGRRPELGRRLMPDVRWLGGDLSRMTRADQWAAALSGIDAVVNASGALQSGAKDDLTLAQDHAIRALVAACEIGGVTRFVQISAPGAAADASTAFLRTKASADAALRMSKLDWTILKPGLVISTNSFGGTTLIRMLAAFPLVLPLVLAQARIQTVAASDVAEAVRKAVVGEVATRRDYDLVEDAPHSLADVVGLMRLWAGWKPPAMRLELPRWVGAIAAWGADLAGWLGWRSPLRSTALKVLAEDVLGDPGPWRQASGRRLSSLPETLMKLPSTAQERVFGRAQLVFPLLVLVLAGFWLATGLIGFWQTDRAQADLPSSIPPDVARNLVLGGSIVDVLVGLGLLVRRWTQPAAWASILLSLGYLAAGTWLTPDLWADPLGPFVKVLPAMALALAVAALAGER